MRRKLHEKNRAINTMLGKATKLQESSSDKEEEENDEEDREQREKLESLTKY